MFHKGKSGKHEASALPRRATDKQDRGLARPARGLLIMLGSCVAFLAFLALLTIAVHFIML